MRWRQRRRGEAAEVRRQCYKERGRRNAQAEADIKRGRDSSGHQHALGTQIFMQTNKSHKLNLDTYQNVNPRNTTVMPLFNK